MGYELFAQATCTINGESADCGAAGGLALAILLPLLVVGILSFVGWLMMLIHAIQHDIPNKAVWIVLLLVFNVAWIIYYFVVKRPFDAGTLAPASAQTPPASSSSPTDQPPPTPPASI